MWRRLKLDPVREIYLLEMGTMVKKMGRYRKAAAANRSVARYPWNDPEIKLQRRLIAEGREELGGSEARQPPMHKQAKTCGTLLI